MLIRTKIGCTSAHQLRESLSRPICPRFDGTNWAVAHDRGLSIRVAVRVYEQQCLPLIVRNLSQGFSQLANLDRAELVRVRSNRLGVQQAL